MLLAIGLNLRPRANLPPDLSYRVTISGMAQERSARSAASEAEVYPQTRVRIAAEPLGAAIADLEFGLYRRAEHGLVRVGPGEGLAVEVYRGAAVFTGRAGDLVGERPGTHELYVVVARPGQLPPHLRFEAADDPITRLAAVCRCLVYRRILKLRSPQGAADERGR
jgi:hypothetical protein